MRKNTFIALVAIFLTVTCLIFSNANPVPRGTVGTKATATYKELDGVITLTQIENTVGFTGQLNKGFNTTETAVYAVKVDLRNPVLFFLLGIKVTPPGTDPFDVHIPNLDLNALIGSPIAIQFGGKTMESAIIVGSE